MGFSVFPNSAFIIVQKTEWEPLIYIGRKERDTVGMQTKFDTCSWNFPSFKAGLSFICINLHIVIPDSSVNCDDMMGIRYFIYT